MSISQPIYEFSLFIQKKVSALYSPCIASPQSAIESIKAFFMRVNEFSFYKELKKGFLSFLAFLTGTFREGVFTLYDAQHSSRSAWTPEYKIAWK